jgi:hypothetical protein
MQQFASASPRGVVDATLPFRPENHAPFTGTPPRRSIVRTAGLVNATLTCRQDLPRSVVAGQDFDAIHVPSDPWDRRGDPHGSAEIQWQHHYREYGVDMGPAGPEYALEHLIR